MKSKNSLKPALTQRQLAFALAGFLTAAVGYGLGMYRGLDYARAHDACPPAENPALKIPLSIAKPSQATEVQP